MLLWCCSLMLPGWGTETLMWHPLAIWYCQILPGMDSEKLRLAGPEIIFSYLRQENSTGRGVPTFSVWYRACLSGTARGCLAQALRHSLLFIYVSKYDVTTQSATFPATSEGFRDVKENFIGMFLFEMHISTRYEKNNQVPVLDPDRHISVSGDTMSHPSLGYRLDWYL